MYFRFLFVHFLDDFCESQGGKHWTNCSDCEKTCETFDSVVSCDCQVPGCACPDGILVFYVTVKYLVSACPDGILVVKRADTLPYHYNYMVSGFPGCHLNTAQMFGYVSL